MKNSIYSKIKNETLFMSFISALLICVAVFSGIAYIRHYIVLSGEELGDSAAGDSREALERQTVTTLLSLAENKASISDQRLAEVVRAVEMLSNSATEIVANPDDYMPSEILPPDPKLKGVYSAQFQHARNVSPEELKEEVSLVGNVWKLMLNVLEESDDIYQVFLGTETGAFITVDDAPDGDAEYFDPRERPWYTAAKEAGKLTWSDIYEDAWGRGLEITCAMPYYGPDGGMLGVVGVAMQLETLNEIVETAKLGADAYAFMVGADGRLILSDTIRTDADGSIIRINLLESENINLRNVAKNMLEGGHGIERFTSLEGREYFIAYYGLKNLPWSLASVLSVDEATRPAFVSEQRIIELKRSAIINIDGAILIFALLLAGVFIVAAAQNVLMTKRLAAKLAGPITSLTNSAKIIGAGDLSHKLTVKTGDEIETLADTFNIMIDDITKITSEKERISAELNVAKRIQASMLPCIFPPYPEKPEFDIYASMLPAKEVGGDFYDFFFVEEDVLAIVIADVSGKGVPAALFMVITKTLIKNNACLGKSPREVFETVNDILCENNEAGMFVTAFMGYFNIKTGALTYVNAGHNPPLLGRNGGFAYLDVLPGIILAAFGGVSYKEVEITLGNGDSVLMYTDGVTEAFNENGEMFTEERLLNAANSYKSLGLKETLNLIKGDIDGFAGAAEQADDVTMLLLRRNDISYNCSKGGRN